MLVIISDLHLTDGTSGETIKAGAFGIFAERLRDMAYNASWRQDGTYRPVEKIDIILLGDILDIIRSTSWLQQDSPRPWAKQDDTFAQKTAQINAAILQHNEGALSILRELSAGRVTLPKGKDGKPAEGDRQAVEVDIHYMVGNHDWFYHLSGAAYDKIRRDVIKAMGLANPARTPFPHDPSESAAIEKIYSAHNVFARHGDIYDDYNYEGDRDQSSLGDAIVVELLNQFPTAVNNSLGGRLPEACVNGLKEIDNVRPLLLIPVWVESVLKQTCPKNLANQVKDVWNGLVDDFLKTPFVKSHDRWYNPFDKVDQFEWALRLSKGVPFRDLSKIAVAGGVLGGGRDSFYKNVKTEAEFKNRGARYFVYGHTHHPVVVPLDVVPQNGAPLEQMYMNSGTWRRVHEMAQIHPDEQEFLSYNVMTYLAFYKGDERGGRSFETWTGGLAVN